MRGEPRSSRAMRRGSGSPPPVFTALSFGERFTLWSVRCWTEAARYGVHLHPILREAFARAGAEGGYLALNQVLCTAAAAARRSIVIHRRNCLLVSADELMLLGLVADLQADRTQTVHGKIGEWMAPWGVRTAMPALATFADRLSEAGISLPRRKVPRAPTVFPRRAAAMDPPRCKLH